VITVGDFLAAFPKSGNHDPGTVLKNAARVLESTGPGKSTGVHRCGDSAFVVTSSSAHAPASYIAPDNRGWVVIRGIIFDVRSDTPRVDPRKLWEDFAHGGPGDWNRYEGSFALAIWDARERRGIALNDQTSILNLYFCEDPYSHYVMTAAFPLARALGRRLNAAGVRELLARGALVAPTAMYDGFERVDVGEHLEFNGGNRRSRRHWHFPATSRPWSFQRSVEEAASVAEDRVRRYAAAAGDRLVMDLTSGYDSRLLAAAADHANLHPVVTVNGTNQDVDVRLSRRAAEAAGWPLIHFDTRKEWESGISSDVRRELACRADGNLPFSELFHHRITRPRLAENYDFHTIGVGGEFIRYHPWSHEFFHIGRRRAADIDKVLKYRMLQDGPPPAGLFAADWYPQLVRDLRRRVESICEDSSGALNTLQLDAVHAWKQTGHSSLYVSGAFGWLPTVVPSMGAGFITTGMSIPWRHRLTVRLTRHVIHTLCPRVAAAPTHYGGTAGPVGVRNLHRHLYQPLKRFGYMAGKLDRVLLGGRVSDWFGAPGRPAVTPYDREEIRAFLASDELYTRDLFTPDGLKMMVPATGPLPREKLALRLATVEVLCRELDFRPEKTFLND
jgi:hypothetical protein